MLSYSYLIMSKKIIKVSCDNNTEFFLKKIDIAKKYNYTAQYIGEILNGKTKKNYIVHGNKVYNLEYIIDENTIQKYFKNNKKKDKINNDDSVKEEKKQNIKAEEPFDYFFKFLNEITNKTQNKEDFIKITSLYDKFKCSDYYLNCEKDMRRNILTRKNMKNYFESNKETVLSFKKNYNKIIDGEKVNAYKVLIGYKFKD
jgi:hypothetical protein